MSHTVGLPSVTVELQAGEIATHVSWESLAGLSYLMIRMKCLVAPDSQKKHLTKNNLQLYSCPKYSEIIFSYPTALVILPGFNNGCQL